MLRPGVLHSLYLQDKALEPRFNDGGKGAAIALDADKGQVRVLGDDFFD